MEMEINKNFIDKIKKDEEGCRVNRGFFYGIKFLTLGDVKNLIPFPKVTRVGHYALKSMRKHGKLVQLFTEFASVATDL